MIQTIVLFKLDEDHARSEARSEIAAKIREALGELPGVQGLAIGVPADAAAERSWDLSLVLHFEDLETARAFDDHPAHVAFADAYMKPRTQVVKAWLFELLSS
ncbi:MAG: Dabb family protein [Myxococcales bacterium]|nr:Dabb family protein [Myxococcales bacterium]